MFINKVKDGFMYNMLLTVFQFISFKISTVIVAMISFYNMCFCFWRLFMFPDCKN